MVWQFKVTYWSRLSQTVQISKILMFLTQGVVNICVLLTVGQKTGLSKFVTILIFIILLHSFVQLSCTSQIGPNKVPDMFQDKRSCYYHQHFFLSLWKMVIKSFIIYFCSFLNISPSSVCCWLQSIVNKWRPIFW